MKTKSIQRRKTIKREPKKVITKKKKVVAPVKPVDTKSFKKGDFIFDKRDNKVFIYDSVRDAIVKLEPEHFVLTDKKFKEIEKMKA